MATKKTKKNTEEKKVVSKKVILGNRITEKAALGAERGAYTFNVQPNATKSEIIKTIKALYKVTPVKIAITKIKEKAVFVKGKHGVKAGGKKAVVYLKKGDKIEFV